VDEKEQVIGVLRSFARELRSVFGDDLLKVLLFGSFATDTHHAESDVDVMVVLTDEGKRRYEKKTDDARSGFVAAEISAVEGTRCPLSVLIWSESRYREELDSGSAFGSNLKSKSLEIE